MNAIAQINNVELAIIHFNSVPVVTTDMLASLYGTDTNNIKVNYSRNIDRFVEGKHFYKLQGSELKEFKNKVTLGNLVQKNAKHLTLWTERGAARHAKMLDTEQAWEVFEKLEDDYFSVREAVKQQIDDEVRKPYSIHDFVNRTQNDVMMYIWSLQEQVCSLGGTPLPMPFDKEKMAQGFIGHFLNGKRMMLNVLGDSRIGVEFVEYNAMNITETEIADIITRGERMPRQVLSDIADAALKRLAK